MCHTARWEIIRSFLVVLIKSDGWSDSHCSPASPAIFISPYMSRTDICHVVKKLDNLSIYFWGISAPPPPSYHTYAENNVLLSPILCNLWSCQLEQGDCGTLIALSAAGTSSCGGLGSQPPVGLGSWWHLSTSTDGMVCSAVCVQHAPVTLNETTGNCLYVTKLTFLKSNGHYVFEIIGIKKRFHFSFLCSTSIRIKHESHTL